MQINSPSGSCTETSGFLFSHRCTSPAVFQCDLCGRAICTSHRRTVPASDLQRQGIIHGGPPGSPADVCITCARRVGPPHSTARGSDDPYWYSDRYSGYCSYGSGRWGSSFLAGSAASSASDPVEFTEADGESLRQEGDGNFEMEISGS